MTYRITGLAPDAFAALFDLDDNALALHGARRVVADAKPGYPCRVTLEDAEIGETLILVNHVSHDAATPFRSTHAIYVRANADEAPTFVDETPPVFNGRTLSLRGYDEDGMLRRAAIALPGASDAGIRDLFAHPEVATVHIHNAAPGCFAAKAVRA